MMASNRLRPTALAAIALTGISLAGIALPAAGQTRYTPGPSYATPPTIATPQPGTTPRDATAPTAGQTNQNEINPYFRKNQAGQGQGTQQSPLYQPYQPNQTDAQKAQSDPFRPPSSMQGTGGTSAYQKQVQNPPQPKACDNFNRIGDGYAECRSNQAKQTYQNQQLKAQQQKTR